jgi:signal transduction histidine kinase/ligand-binding sensor domain-containing protein
MGGIVDRNYRYRHWNIARLMTSRVPLAAACAIVWALAAPSASAQYRFDSWTTDNGLPENSVNSIVQTGDGYLWLATFGGLIRYDGMNFRVFTPGNTSGLTTSRFLDLYDTGIYGLWITTENQGLTRYKGGVFTTYTRSDGLPAGGVVDIYAGDQSVLIDTEAGGFSWRDGTFTPDTHSSAETVPIVPNQARYRSRSGSIWYYQDGRLHKREGGRTTVDVPADISIRGFYEDSQGQLWVWSSQDILESFKDGKFTTYAIPGLPRIRMNAAYEDKSGTLWFGLFEDGLVAFRAGKFTRFTSADGLAGNGVNSIFQDREGNIWVGSKEGLTRLTTRGITAYSARDGLAADRAYAIAQTRDGAILIGSWPGLTRYQNGEFTKIGKDYDIDISQEEILSVMEDREGGLWVGSWGWGAQRIKDGKVTSITPRDGTARAVVRGIYQDRSGDVWIGTENGVGRYKAGTVQFFTTDQGVSGNSILTIYEDSHGDIWFGTDMGLTRYHDGAFRTYTAKDGLTGNIVRAIYEDRDSALWVGTYDSGMSRLKDGKFTHFTTNEGLFDNGAFRILEDNRGYFWISCNVGIYRVSRNELNEFAEGKARTVTCTAYGKRDGLMNPECNGGSEPAGIKAADGKLWFPTQGGVIVVDPENEPANTEPPLVTIEQVILDGKAMAFHNGVEIGPGSENLEIHYAGLSFIRPDQVRFRYRLEGLDNDWVEAGTRRIAYYSHIPPGRYRFSILAANADGVWNLEGAGIPFVVNPPFYRRSWFLAGIAAVLAGAVLLLHRWRIRVLNRAHAAREAFSRQLMELQESERKRIANELHDSLGQSLSIIMNRATMCLETPGNHDHMVEQVGEIAIAASEAIEETREIAHNLRPVELDRLGLSKALRAMIKKVSGSSHIQIRDDIDNIDGIFPADSEINLYRIVQECLNNVARHSRATEAAVAINRDSRGVRIIVRDNGVGFAPPENGQPPTDRYGLGLSGISERARLIGGKCSFESALTRGTTVTITVSARNIEGGHLSA